MIDDEPDGLAQVPRAEPRSVAVPGPALRTSACTRAGEGDQGVIRICKATLSGASPGRIREQAEGIAAAQLRDLAVQLAAILT